MAEPQIADDREPNTCLCGGGWTFDFQQKRVYCRTCEQISSPQGDGDDRPLSVPMDETEGS